MVEKNGRRRRSGYIMFGKVIIIFIADCVRRNKIKKIIDTLFACTTNILESSATSHSYKDELEMNSKD
jgi:hypothetical protein